MRCIENNEELRLYRGGRARRQSGLLLRWSLQRRSE
jgi:hypothetical protein